VRGDDYGDDYAAVVLAGGAGSRLGGVDKPALRLGGRLGEHSLLDGVLTVVADAAEIVVVGPRRPTTVPVRWTVEAPAGSGPVSALAAGLAALGPAEDRDVAVLAADSVGLRADTVSRLRTALAARPDADGVLLRDADGRVQWLIGVWRPAALRRALPAEPANQGLGRVLSVLAVVELPERAGESADVDTPDDLRRARHRFAE
jgi:molybdopterin-guanine dinucleotide biosynthesis protein A